MKGRRTFGLVMAILVTVVVFGVFTVLAAPIVTIESGQEIPVVDDIFQITQPTFTTPFTLTHRFEVPSGTTKVHGALAPGPCEHAEFLGATPGYTYNSELGGCSWIQWLAPVPSVVTWTVRYTGFWSANYIYLGAVWASPPSPCSPIVGTPYCLIREPDANCNCYGDLRIGPQPAPYSTYLPIVTKVYSDTE
jgi:hypothetical protein